MHDVSSVLDPRIHPGGSVGEHALSLSHQLHVHQRSVGAVESAGSRTGRDPGSGGWCEAQALSVGELIRHLVDRIMAMNSLFSFVMCRCALLLIGLFQEGITWMRFLRKFGLNGILADDMGLGKTLQTLTVLAMGIQESGWFGLFLLASFCSL